MTAILISRLQLNLRAVGYDNGSSGRFGPRDAMSAPQTETFSFKGKYGKDEGTATFFSLGNLGESVQSDTYFEEASFDKVRGKQVTF